MDRAPVYGTDSESPQVSNSQDVTPPAPARNSTCYSTQPPNQPQDAPDTPADLAEIIASWPSLPEAVKAGIVAMVKASCPTPTPEADGESKE